MAYRMEWKVFGAEGHRQRQSFFESAKWDLSRDGDIRIIEADNSDRTGTNEFTLFRVTRNSKRECEEEFDGQISDGYFEESVVGETTLISEKEVEEYEIELNIYIGKDDFIGTLEEAKAAADECINYTQQDITIYKDEKHYMRRRWYSVEPEEGDRKRNIIEIGGGFYDEWERCE